jgi:transcriptional regulator with XRE-family HTH domain
MPKSAKARKMLIGTLNGKVRDPEYLRELGGQLKAMRQRRGLTQKQVGAHLKCDHSSVCRAEYGEMTDHLAGEIELMLSIASDGHETWFMDFVGAERTATALKTWQPLVIPGLLQTEAYARQVLRGANPGRPDAEVAERVAARMNRQEVWHRADPPMLCAVIAEPALRKPLGGTQVMGAQLGHLIEMATRPNITIQVLPALSEHPTGLLAPFVVASFAPGARDPVAHMENALDGTTTPEPDQVHRLTLLFEDLMREALRPAESARLITEVTEEWT